MGNIMTGMVASFHKGEVKMNSSMVRCRECGRWFFNWKKLSNHLILEHGYGIEIPEEAG